MISPEEDETLHAEKPRLRKLNLCALGLCVRDCHELYAGSVTGRLTQHVRVLDNLPRYFVGEANLCGASLAPP